MDDIFPGFTRGWLSPELGNVVNNPSSRKGI